MNHRLSPSSRIFQYTREAARSALLFASVTASSFAPSASGAEPVLLRQHEGLDSILHSVPGPFVAFGGESFFAADDGVHGVELWKTDGTEAGTRLVRDINPGPTGSGPVELIEFDGYLYFAAETDDYGRELWRTDGTAAGTTLVKDINPGTIGSEPTGFTLVNGELFFSASNEPSDPWNLPTNAELWKTDGTAAGTVLVHDIFPGSAGSFPSELIELNGRLIFQAEDETGGRELWSSDGTSEGTVLLKDIHPVLGSHPSELIRIGGTVFFHADDGTHGRELWKTDGTSAGTVMVKDIAPGPESSSPASFINAGGSLIFRARDGTSGIELWKSDGTAEGTQIVKDIRPGSGSSFPNSFVYESGVLYFSANDGESGFELWTSDGTEAGTTLAADIHLGASSSFPGEIAGLDGAVYFRADDGSHGEELWTSDGTPGGTALVIDLYPGVGASTPQRIAVDSGTLLFRARTDITEFELWKSDGTANGTVLVKDIATSPAAAAFTASKEIVVSGGAFYFVSTSAETGAELWKSDGTPGGTMLLKDIYPGEESSNPEKLFDFGGTLYFTADDGVHGRELWKSDGTTAGTGLVRDIRAGEDASNPTGFLSFGGALFFNAYDESGSRLWRSDGTEHGTVPIEGGVFANATLRTVLARTSDGFFLVMSTPDYSHALWKSDGTAEGTYLVKDVSPEREKKFVVVDDVLYFTVRNQGNTVTLWRSDGTDLRTFELKTFAFDQDDPDWPLHLPDRLTEAGGAIYFSAGSLYKTDGTPAGTIEVLADTKPAHLVAIGNRLFFAGRDDEHGMELRSTDGSPQGTRLIKDIDSGSVSSMSAGDPGGPVDVHGVVYFSASDASDGRELWRSDGTAPGTYRVTDLAAGPPSANVSELTRYGDQLIFTATQTDGHPGVFALPLANRPELVSAPESRFVASGDAAVIEAEITGDDLLYYWYHDGELMADVSGPVLQFSSLNSSHSGTYRLIASNSGGAVEIDFRLTVDPVPPIIHTSTHSPVEGFRLTFSSMGSVGYRVEGSEDLKTWETLDEGVVDSAESVIQFLDPAATSVQKRFYRVVLIP